MSQQLDVKLTKPIELTDLWSRSEEALALLTGCRHIPKVLGGRFEGGQLLELRPNETLNRKDYFVFFCENTSNCFAGVSVVDLEPMPGYISESESGPRACIEVSAGGPEAFVLAAALALALSELCSTAIEDDVMFWSKDSTVLPTQFLRSLVVCGESLSFEAACQLMYGGLPKAARTPKGQGEGATE